MMTMKTCSRCGATKPTTEFGKGPARAPDGLSYWCKQCHADYQRDRAKEPAWRSRRRGYGKNDYLRHREERLVFTAEYHRNHPEVHRKAVKKWDKTHPEQRQALIAARRDRNRQEVFSAYGGYVCAHCGETDPDVLEIDHINNDGAEHRRELTTIIGRGGSAMYTWLRRNGFPPGFQVLCANCNKRKYHQHRRALLAASLGK